MKIKTAMATLTTLYILSFSAFATGQSEAHEISAAQASTLQPMGVITIDGLDGTMADIGQQLAVKAHSQGAAAFHIVEERMNGNYHATALIYR